MTTKLKIPAADVGKLDRTAKVTIHRTHERDGIEVEFVYCEMGHGFAFMDTAARNCGAPAVFTALQAKFRLSEMWGSENTCWLEEAL